VVIEGAGSPAEINLRDQVNNRILAHADAAAILVSDIDRGGAFAHLFGTWSLVPDATRERLAGFVLNRFRGDESLLSPGPERLTERTGMAHVGTLPMLRHQLPDEEGATIRADPPAGAPRVAIIRFPYGSNLDEFRLLPLVARTVWTADPADLDAADWVILPGSKHVAADLAWMRARGLDGAVQRAAADGRRVHGVCGGAMVLGRSVDDPEGVETSGRFDGLGLLPFETRLVADKVAHRVTVDVDVDGVEVDGYEIRHGRLDDERPIHRSGSVTSTLVHGLLEDPRLVERWFGAAVVDPLPETFDLLADAVEARLDISLLHRLVEGLT
jgi:adenosylcobyric acid synthase